MQAAPALQVSGQNAGIANRRGGVCWGSAAAMGPGRDDSEKAPVGCAMLVQYSSTWEDAGATRARELRYLRCIWTAGRRRHPQVLPPVQTKILRKRLKSEPLAWISALATCFSSQSSQGWGAHKTFQVYLTETQPVVAHRAPASPTARSWEGRQAGHGHPSPRHIPISARDARQGKGRANIYRCGRRAPATEKAFIDLGTVAT